MPSLMVKVPPRSVKAVLAPGPWRRSGISPGAERADHLGEVDALDRAVAHGNAALAGERGLDLLGVPARAAQLKRDLGASLEHAELGGIREQGLGLDAVEEKIAIEGGNLFGSVEHELAARVSVIKLHAAERGIQYAVPEGKAERARPKLEMEDPGLAHIDIDVGIEGCRLGGGRRLGL